MTRRAWFGAAGVLAFGLMTSGATAAPTTSGATAFRLTVGETLATQVYWGWRRHHHRRFYYRPFYGPYWGYAPRYRYYSYGPPVRFYYGPHRRWHRWWW